MIDVCSSSLHSQRRDGTMVKNGTVGDIYAHLSRDDIPAMVQRLDPQIEWTLTAGLPNGGTYRGRDAVLKLFAGYAEIWEGLQVVPEEFFSSGNVVIVLGHYDGVSRQSGKRAVARFAHVWRLRDGLAERFETIADTRTILEALS
ncbi:hypothetical protein SOCE26_054120 [Sorangium cellulosum]|uniref:SnoaL-like domain-containing protein n=1 Tax=Sorangium cellulosum TaxID=56 RepID=A0A2L0EXG3_SORCE|nr:nuclear transport factor 2 family protein [Sorangium cellulosum]AUX43955.1 hypothetical protein SOCE26_054120 [Sorangium cellulosum]